jgi:hypothetical protein
MWGVPTWAKWVAGAVAVVAIVAIVIVLAPAAIVGATLAAAGTAITAALGAATLPLLGAIAATGISVAARGKIDLTTAFHAAVGAASGYLLAAGAALVSSIMSKSTDAATTASEVSPTFKSSPTIGMAAHTEFSVQIEGQGGIANKAIFNNSLLRPDGYFTNTNTVLELKPGNPNGVIQGLKQLNEYQGLSNGAGELWLYNIDSNGFFNYWRY